MKHALIGLLLLAAPCFAGPRLNRILYRASQAAVVIASSLDMGSSVGKRELNPILRSPNQQFGRRGIAIKTGIVFGSLGAGELLARKKSTPAVTVANFAMAVVTARQAALNLSIPRALLSCR